jgi:hypothetical protein
MPAKGGGNQSSHLALWIFEKGIEFKKTGNTKNIKN